VKYLSASVLFLQILVFVFATIFLFQQLGYVVGAGAWFSHMGRLVAALAPYLVLPFGIILSFLLHRNEATVLPRPSHSSCWPLPLRRGKFISRSCLTPYWIILDQGLSHTRAFSFCLRQRCHRAFKKSLITIRNKNTASTLGRRETMIGSTWIFSRAPLHSSFTHNQN
jgi:hypothetical protein